MRTHITALPEPAFRTPLPPPTSHLKIVETVENTLGEIRALPEEKTEDEEVLVEYVRATNVARRSFELSCKTAQSFCEPMKSNILAAASRQYGVQLLLAQYF